jgi:hypothetical protein
MRRAAGCAEREPRHCRVMGTNGNSRRSHHRQVPATRPYEEWATALVEQAALSGVAIAHVRIFRVSSGSPSVFAAHLAISLASSAADDPDVALALEHGATVSEDSAEGDTLRAELGTYTLRFDSLPGGTGRGRIGYVTLLGRTLFVYLLASAAELNLSTGVHHDERSNASVEVCRTTVRCLGPAALKSGEGLGMHWVEDTRPARDEAEAMLLARTMVEYGARPFLRGVLIDLTTTAGKIHWRMVMGYAADDRETVNARMSRGKAGLLLAHRLPEKVEGRTPFTHEAATRTVTDARGRTREVADPYAPVPTPGSGQVLDLLVRKVLARAEPAITAREPVPWDELAIWASDNLGLTSRSFSDVAGGTPRAIADLENPGLALRRALQPRYVEAWRTGWLEWRTAFNTEVPGVTDRLEDTGTLSSKGKVIRRAQVECPRPDTSLTDDEWDRLAAVVAPRSPLSGRALIGRRSPFDSSDSWVESDGSTRCVLAKSGILQLHRRNPEGALRDGTDHLLTVSATELYVALGRDLEQLAVELAGHATSLQRATHPRDEAIAAQRRRIDERIAELDSCIAGAEVRIDRAVGAGDTTAETEHFHRRDAYVAERDDLAHRAASFEEPDPELSGHAMRDADFADLAAVAAGLQVDWTEPGSTASSLPAALSSGVRRVYRGTFRLEPGPTSDAVRWRATAHIPLVDGTVATRDRSGQVPNRTRHRSGRTSQVTRAPKDLLARRFIHGDDLATIAAAAGLTSGGRNTRVQQILTQTLATGLDGRNVPDASLRRALIDAPSPGPGLAVWSWIYDEADAAADLHPGYRDHVVATYSDPGRYWGYTWAGADFTEQRRALDATLAAVAEEAPGYPILDATVLLDTDYRRAAMLLVHRHKVGRLHQPPPLTGNWTHQRGKGLPDPADRLLLPHACPHPDCPGRGAGSRAATAVRRHVWADHILWVPELWEGILCSACRRTPTRADCRYPDIYLDRWTRTGRARTVLGR